MNEKEFLNKIRSELREFEILLDLYEPKKAFEIWRREGHVDVVKEMLDDWLKEWIFVKEMNKDALKRLINKYCKFIQWDLEFLENFSNIKTII
jgi:hypothetical protein